MFIDLLCYKNFKINYKSYFKKLKEKILSPHTNSSLKNKRHYIHNNLRKQMTPNNSIFIDSIKSIELKNYLIKCYNDIYNNSFNDIKLANQLINIELFIGKKCDKE